MIDRIVNSALDSASPLLIRWRVTFFFLSLVYMSPEFEELFRPLFYNLSLSEFWDKVTHVILSNKIWSAFIMAASVFYIIPSLIYYTLRKASSKNIKHAELLVDELVKFRKKTHSEIEDIVATSFEDWKCKALAAERDIEKLKNMCEASVFSALFYTFSSLVLNVLIAPLSITLFVVACGVLYWSSRKILLAYLRNIAMFRILGPVNTNQRICDKCEMNEEHENNIQFIES